MFDHHEKRWKKKGKEPKHGDHRQIRKLIKQYKKDGKCDGVLLQVDASGKPLEVENDGDKTKILAEDGKSPLPYFVQGSKTLKQRFGTSPEAIIWHIKKNHGVVEKAVNNA